MAALHDLIGRLRQRYGAFPDKRPGANAQYTMASIGLAAFSVFFMHGHGLVALDGTAYRRSAKVHCPRRSKPLPSPDRRPQSSNRLYRQSSPK